jgi:hypothetical protein
MSTGFRVHTDGFEDIVQSIGRSATAAEHRLAETIKSDSEPFVPALTGEFSDNVTVKENLIIYPAPFARFLYWGKLMIDPNTGSAWAKAGVKKITAAPDLVFTKTVHPQAQSQWFEAAKAQNLQKWIKVAEREVDKDV